MCRECSPGGKGGGGSHGHGPRRGPVLRSLDLAVLPRDDSGPPSELQARREKFARFEKDCSEVNPPARNSMVRRHVKEALNSAVSDRHANHKSVGTQQSTKRRIEVCTIQFARHLHLNMLAAYGIQARMSHVL